MNLGLRRSHQRTLTRCVQRGGRKPGDGGAPEAAGGVFQEHWSTVSLVKEPKGDKGGGEGKWGRKMREKGEKHFPWGLEYSKGKKRGVQKLRR